MTTMHSPSAPQKPKLVDRVRLATRTHHYGPRTEDVTMTMIYTHVLNRGPAGVPSPADRLLISCIPSEEIGCKILQPSSIALMPPAIGQAKHIQPVPAHPQNPGEGNRLHPLQP